MKRLRAETMPADMAEVTFDDYFDSPAVKPLLEEKVNVRPVQKRQPVWPNWKAGYIGYLTGRGYSSRKISEILDDGTSKDTVRGQWRRWGLPIPKMEGKRCVLIPLAISVHTATLLEKRAAAIGVTPEVFLRRVTVGVVTDDLYKAVVDDRHDEEDGFADPPAEE